MSISSKYFADEPIPITLDIPEDIRSCFISFSTKSKNFLYVLIKHSILNPPALVGVVQLHDQLYYATVKNECDKVRIKKLVDDTKSIIVSLYPLSDSYSLSAEQLSNLQTAIYNHNFQRKSVLKSEKIAGMIWEKIWKPKKRSTTISEEKIKEILEPIGEIKKTDYLNNEYCAFKIVKRKSYPFPFKFVSMFLDRFFSLKKALIAIDHVGWVYVFDKELISLANKKIDEMNQFTYAHLAGIYDSKPSITGPLPSFLCKKISKVKKYFF